MNKKELITKKKKKKFEKDQSNILNNKIFYLNESKCRIKIARTELFINKRLLQLVLFYD